MRVPMRVALTCALLLFAFAASVSQAQTTTESFESQTNSATTFVSLGRTFSIGTPFYIQGGYPGKGWNGSVADNKYIDNSGFAAAGVGTDFNLNIQAGSKFLVRSFWLFLSDNALNQSVSGSVTITGKLGGVVQFVAGPVSSGFNTSTANYNGYSLIDLATFGGFNSSNATIDELEIASTNHFNYVALDALTWTLIDDRIFYGGFE